MVCQVSVPRQKNAALPLILDLCLIVVNPLFIIAGKAFLRSYRSSVMGDFVLSIALALFFCNRQFGVGLGGGAIDDVPQYVFLFQAATQHDLWFLFSIWTFEPGFIILTKLISFTTSAPIGYLFFVFLIINFSMIRASSILSTRNSAVPVLFFFGLFGTNTYIIMHVLRQAIGFSFILLALSRSNLNDNPKRLSWQSFVLLAVGCSMHVSVIPIAFAFLATKLLWTKTPWVLTLGIVSAFLAPAIATTIFNIISARSSRIEGYSAASTTAIISSTQLLIAAVLSLFLMISAVRGNKQMPITLLRYLFGITSTGMVGVALMGNLPMQVVLRELALVLAIVSIVAGELFASAKLPEILRIFIVAVIVIRLASLFAFPPPHLQPFAESGALNPLSGIVFNAVELTTTTREIPAYLGWGDL